MKDRKVSVYVFLAALLALALLQVFLVKSFAQSVPQLINYQGRLTDDAGAPLDGVSVELTFSFYGTETGSTILYMVNQKNVAVNKGVYHVLIGSGILIPGTEPDLGSVFRNNAEVWMGIRVENDPEMIPRTRIGSVSYSLMAEKATQADTVLAVDTDFLRNLDLDGDGHYKPVSTNLPNDDCNDGDPSVYLHAFETCGDGLDTSCVNGDCRGMGSYDTAASARGVAVEGNFAYVADFSAGLTVIDIGNPHAPTLAGSYDTTGFAYGGVVKSGNYVYMTSGSSGLYIINVSDPYTPTFTGRYDTVGEARGVVVVGSYAYMTVYTEGLYIINVSTPSAPTYTGYYDTTGTAVGVDVVGIYAYVADGSAGLQIINISIPSSPSLVGFYDTTADAIGVKVAGGYAYLANASTGLLVIDVSTPSTPSLAGYCNTPGTAWDVYLDSNYAYVADYSSGLQVIDISDPTDPTPAGVYDTPGYSYGLDVSGDYAYMADGGSGLQVVFAPNPL